MPMLPKFQGVLTDITGKLLCSTSRTRAWGDLRIHHTIIDVSRINILVVGAIPIDVSDPVHLQGSLIPLGIKLQQYPKALKNACIKNPFFFFSFYFSTDPSSKILNRGYENEIGLLTQGTKSHSHLKAALYKLEVVIMCLNQLRSAFPEVWTPIPINFPACAADENPKSRQITLSSLYWMSLQLDGP